MVNAVKKYADLKTDLKFGMKGAYLFFGEEDYMKQHSLFEVRKALLGEEKDGELRHKRINMPEFDGGKIEDAVSVVSPFFGEGITLCEFHEIKFSALKENELKFLIGLLKDIPDDVVVLFYSVSDELDYGNLPKNPSKLLIRLSEVCKPVYFPKEDEIKLVKWTARHIMSEKISFENGVCELLVSECGRDMFVLSNETDKLCAYAKMHEKSRIELNDVREVCCRNNEVKAFDFSNALLNRETDKALEIVTEMKLKKEKPTYILSTVLRTVCDLYSVKTLLDAGYNEGEISRELKMHEYKVGIYRKNCMQRSADRLRKLLSACMDTDIKLKSSSADEYTELEKLVINATTG